MTGPSRKGLPIFTIASLHPSLGPSGIFECCQFEPSTFHLDKLHRENHRVFRTTIFHFDKTIFMLTVYNFEKKEKISLLVFISFSCTINEKALFFLCFLLHCFENFHIFPFGFPFFLNSFFLLHFFLFLQTVQVLI